MAVIMRIDVDEAYTSNHIVTKYFDSLRFKHFFPGLRNLGYLKNLEKLLVDFANRDICANLFFLSETAPLRSMRSLIKKHCVGVHVLFSEITNHSLVRRQSKAIMCATDKKASSLTLHCGGLWDEPNKKWTWVYDETACARATMKYGFKYFLGNHTDPGLWKKTVGEIMVFPSAFWINPAYRDVKRFTAEWLINESKKRDIVVLIHPSEWNRNAEIRNVYEQIVSNCKFKVLR